MQAQSEYATMIEIHYSGSETEIGPQVRQVIASIDPNLSIVEMHSFGEQVMRVFNQERLIARLTELFSLLALALASIGLYGVTHTTLRVAPARSACAWRWAPIAETS